MPAATVEQFLSLAERSGLLDAAGVQDALRQLKDRGGVPGDTSSLASRLVECRILTRFQADHLLAGRHKGFFIGKYKILAILGTGGMGRVYLAEHSIMRRQVALKILPQTQGADPAALARFQREARAVAQLNHPNIVQAYDIDHDGEIHYLVMEYVTGRTIQDFVKKAGPVEPSIAADWIAQAASGLEHAHQAGIVHRDIKPANLLLDQSGAIKILDMGLAVFFEERDVDSLTLASQDNVLGTADYLAPEQALDSHSVDIRADIYSLGATLYFALSGQAPFPQGTVAQKLMAHQSKEPRPLQELNPRVPDRLAAIQRKMMAKRPSDRYATPADVRAVLAPLARRIELPFSNDPLIDPHDLPAHAPMPKGSADPNKNAAPARSTSPPASTRTIAMPPGANSGRPAPARPVSAAARSAAPVTDEAFVPVQGVDEGEELLEAITATPLRSGSSRTRLTRARPPVPAAAPAVSKNTLIAAMGGGAAIVVVALVLLVVWLRPKPAPREVVAPPAVVPLPAVAKAPSKYLDVSQNSDGEWSQIADALMSAKEGQTIRVQAGATPWEIDPIRFGPDETKPGVRTPNITLEGGSKETILRLARGLQMPMLTIEQTSDVVVRDLTIDGGGAAGPVILVRGSVTGVTIENLTLRNFFGDAIRVDAVSAPEEQPLTIKNVTIEGSNADIRGIVFTAANPPPMGPPVGHVAILNCKFTKKFGNGVTVGDRLADLLLERNDFRGGLEGLRLTAGGADWKRVQLRSNFFGANVRPVVSDVGDEAVKQLEASGNTGFPTSASSAPSSP